MEATTVGREDSRISNIELESDEDMNDSDNELGSPGTKGTSAE
jgi:hypothetical protein